MKVIGTAGHIDHGKSTLVHRLTGIDPDRLEEEKRRGMTIDLGFAWLTLPSGEAVSVVDVPGHERFIKNMLAGSAGVDVALLVVAADESLMPQTREHLDILHLLGVERGVVALTKRDLVDDEWLALVTDEVAETLEGTTLSGSPIVPVSSTTGEGITELLEVLDRVIAEMPSRRDLSLPFVPVDRVFTVSGFGTVVTGTLHGGHLAAGDEVEIVPRGRRARVRSMQSHQTTISDAAPGDRVAVNLAGVSRDDVRRGDVLAPPGNVQAVRRFDALVTVLPDAPFPLSHGLEVSLHVGSAERSATLSILEGHQLQPGAEGWVQFRVSDPVPAVRGQRFIVRLPAPARTVAGGGGLDIAPRHRRSDAAAVTRLSGMRADERQAVGAALAGDRPREARDLALLLGLPAGQVTSVLDDLVRGGSAVHLSPAYLATEAWGRLQAKVTHILSAYHDANPLARGMDREELRRRLAITRQVWPSMLKSLTGLGIAEERGNYLSLPGRQGGTASRQDDVERVIAILTRNPYMPLTGTALETEAGVEAGLLRALAAEGIIVQLADGLYLTHDAYRAAARIVMDLTRNAGQVTVAEVRDALPTTRKYALALLEYLDGQRLTRRMGDVRVLGARATECA